MDRYLWDYWGYSRWKRHSSRMLFWYGVAGGPIAASNADEYLALVDKGHVRAIPVPKRKLWKSANKLVAAIHRSTGMELVPWLTQARIESAWRRLQEMSFVGPKIASWILRDVSYLLDHSIDQGPSWLSYDDKRDTKWFRELDLNSRRYFIPIDRHAFRGAKRVGALSAASIRRDFSGIQSTWSYYLNAASEIVAFAEKRFNDPRDWSAFWYMNGSKAIDSEGHWTEEGEW